jgi:hypothetical protein
VLSGVQEQTAKAIVNIFETDRVLGDYANVTLIPGDAGQLTHGRTQTTLASGGLHELIRAYTGAPGAVLRSQLEPFLPALEAREPALNDDLYFRNLLSAAADDPVMRRTQDDFFDRTKWQPASALAMASRARSAPPWSTTAGCTAPGRCSGRAPTMCRGAGGDRRARLDSGLCPRASGVARRPSARRPEGHRLSHGCVSRSARRRRLGSASAVGRAGARDR